MINNSKFGIFEECKMNRQVVERLLQYRPYERWINSDDPHEWAMEDPGLWMSYEYFEFFEKSVKYGWTDSRDHFISQNFRLTLWFKEWEQFYWSWQDLNRVGG